MEFHPLANIFPLLDGQAYSDLIADISKHGVREPVWLYDGQILDGRNRWRAADAAGVECETRDYEGDDPAGFVVSLNLHRRHLSESQRAMVAANLANMPAHRPNSANLQTSQAEAADMLGVSTRSVAAAAKVRSEAIPELVAAVERGEVAVSAAAQVATLPHEMQADIVATGPEEVREVAKTLRNVHVSNNSGNNEWYTPEKYLNAARKAMGGIDTDPASSAFANKNVKAKNYYTAETNGLEQKWSGRVWMNPPYAQPLVSEFIEAAVTKFQASEFEEACILVNNATETQWFQKLLSAAEGACFLRGRIKFLDEKGEPANSPLQGQVVVYLGKRPKTFAMAFHEEGTVLFHG
jgi:phage N-6-adenine-methyltransferase